MAYIQPKNFFQNPISREVTKFVFSFQRSSLPCINKPFPLKPKFNCKMQTCDKHLGKLDKRFYIGVNVLLAGEMHKLYSANLLKNICGKL